MRVVRYGDGQAVTELDLIDDVARLYDPTQNAYWDHLLDDPECWCAIKHTAPDASTLVYRGSCDMLDWYNDLDETPVGDTHLGYVHGGFFRTMRAKHQAIVPLLRPKVTVVGHSLGAARSFLEAGLLIANGIMPVAVRGYGCPRVGYAQLSEIVAHCPDALWYRNCHDPVSYAVYRFGLFKHPGAMRQLVMPAGFPDPWLFLADHRLSLYRAGIALLYGAAPAVAVPGSAS